MKSIKIKRLLICIISVIILIFVDQATKNWAENVLKTNGPIDIIKGVLEFYYLPNGNTGAAFGMLEGHQSLFLIIATIICILLLYIINSIPESKKYYILIAMMTLIIAGGIGNMIDRINQNYVTDFIYFSLINFPIFNVADMYVSVGTAILVIILLFVFNENDLKDLETSIKSSFKTKK